MSALRQFLVSVAALGLAASAFPASASEAATPWTSPSWRANEDCAVASRRFDYHAEAATEAPAPAAALGAAKVRPLVAASCSREPLARAI